MKCVPYAEKQERIIQLSNKITCRISTSPLLIKEVANIIFPIV